MVYVFMIEQTFSYTNSFNTNVPFLYLQIRSENFFLTSRSHLRCSVKKLFFKISQHRCFPVDFVKLLRTPFFTEQLRWLLLGFVLTFIFLSFISNQRVRGKKYMMQKHETNSDVWKLLYKNDTSLFHLKIFKLMKKLKIFLLTRNVLKNSLIICDQISSNWVFSKKSY